MKSNHITFEAEQCVTNLYRSQTQLCFGGPIQTITTSRNLKDGCVVLIPKHLYVRIKGKVDEWAVLIETLYGKPIYIYPVPTTYYSPESVRNFLRLTYEAHQISGVILIGQWNVARWVQTKENGVIRSGPLANFYSDLDLHFYRDESDPAIKGLVGAYNRVDRFSIKYEHQNTSHETGETFNYGSEIWCVFWRATGIQNPMRPEDYDKESKQILRFIQKSSTFHKKQYPYFYRKNFLINQNIGMAHIDYVKQVNKEIQGTSAWILENTRPELNWYCAECPAGSSDFIRKFRWGHYKRFIFDIWTHANMIAFWPLAFKEVRARDIFQYTQNGSGFLITPIFGCSSGVFEYCENQTHPDHMYNYALSLIMSEGIDLFSIGTPWKIGFGHPVRGILFEQLIKNGKMMCDIILECENEASYSDWYINQDDHEKHVRQYLYFGDPFLRFDFMGGLA